MTGLATVATLAAASYLAVSLAVLGARTHGYSHVRHTISELGEVGAPYQRLVAFGVFLPAGALLLAAAYMVRDVSQTTAALALCIAVGYAVAAWFPCDPGSPVSGSARQAVHNLGGAVEYVGGGAILLAMGGSHGPAFTAAGGVVFASAVLLSVLPPASVRGLVQRVGEACLFAALAVAMYRLPSGA